MKEKYKLTIFSLYVGLFTISLANLSNDKVFIALQTLWSLCWICVVFIMESILKKR